MKINNLQLILMVFLKLYPELFLSSLFGCKGPICKNHKYSERPNLLSVVKSKRKNLWLILCCVWAFLLFYHYFLGHLMPQAFVVCVPSAFPIHIIINKYNKYYLKAKWKFKWRFRMINKWKRWKYQLIDLVCRLTV